MKSACCTLFLTIVFLIHTSAISAQGCSDAGACSIGSLDPSATFAPDLKNEFNVGINAGAADHEIFVFGGEVGYTRYFGSSFSLNTRLTFLSQSGNDVSESGLGDVNLMANYKPSDILTLSAGVKLPTNKADKEIDGRDLPMDYQSSLGTTDIILGVAYQKSNWLVGVGYQQPVVQNDNRFSSGFTPAFADFQTTYGFERQPDLLVRLSRILELSEKLTFAPGLLPIVHLGNDVVTDPLTHTDFEIEGSSGLTLNATGHFILRPNDRSKLGFNIGFPLVVREKRPDGLTRSFVAGGGYGGSF